ncbi:MAG: hypothetical protein FD126_2170, partial [Elusimicrobia bacterium]
LKGVNVLREPDINLVFCRLPGLRGTGETLAAGLKAKGIRVYGDEGGVFRFVTHRWIDDGGLTSFVAAMREHLA